MPSDRRGRLSTDPFTHRVRKDGTVAVSRGGRVVSTIGGSRAARLVSELEAARDESAVQQLLARATGNHRRGTERASDGGEPG